MNAQDFFDHLAQKILAQHSGSPADLRNILILLPNYHAATPLSLALQRHAACPTLLLPNMLTLNDWAQSVTQDAPLLAESQRGALLYRHLSQHNSWFDEADLWAVTQEMLTLFDELTYSLTRLPTDAETFARAVQQAYQARQNASLQLEARLIFELWHAMQAGSELDSARAYQQRLANLAAHATQPLFVLLTSDGNALEQRFFSQYAQRAPVTKFDLRELLPTPHNAIALALNHHASAPLRQQAAQLRNDLLPPLGERLRFFAAHSLEHEARAATLQIRLWLQAGKRSIAVVAQDRLVARRVRALLERHDILVSDETGWTLATLSVSSALERWLTALQSDFYHHDLLDLLKSPFIFADLAAAERKTAVFQLEQVLRKHNIIKGLDNFIAFSAEQENLQPLLLRLRRAAALLERNKRRKLSDWLQALNDSLRLLAIDAGWQNDAAGTQLLAALHTWQRELSSDEGRYAFADWRRWLAQQLDSQTYRDSSIDSPVRFTHLAASRWRVFDAVLLLGADADHLPSVGAGGRWFNDAVRSSLNLATRQQLASRQRDDLLALLLLNDCVRVTWQQEHRGENQLLSPYLSMLRDLHQMAYDDDLGDNELAQQLNAEADATPAANPSFMPHPQAAAEALPNHISISGYNSLVACPYQFYARHILRLNELDEVQEGVEKSDYGDCVHRILQQFQQRYPLLSEHHPAEIEQALRQLSETEFAALLQRNFSARAWLSRWVKIIPAYLAWQRANEQEGWRYAAAESAFDLPLNGIQLRGRIDRLDQRGTEKRVLDYKTQNNQILNKKLQLAGEDVQLAGYAWALQAEEAAFVSLDTDGVKTIPPKHQLAQLAELNAARLEQIFDQLRAGESLPANGIDAQCGYCDMRGLCRKGEWADG